MDSYSADVCVIGAGSAGIGAALSAARAGADVILVERQSRIGGTAANAYVCNWEPGPAGPLALEIFERLRRKHRTAITCDHNPGRKVGPFGLWLPDPDARWTDTLRRSGRPPARWRAVTFDPEAYVAVVESLLEATGRCRILTGCEFVEANTAGRERVESVEARRREGGTVRVTARIFIDCTGNAALCRAVGCETMLGADPRSRFGEPCAPESPSKRDLNAVSLCYMIVPAHGADPDATPEQASDPSPPTGWQRVAHVHAAGVSDGAWIVNPLALLPGWMFVEKGPEAARKEARRRALAHWHWLRRYQPFRDRRLHSLAPMLGVRESRRVVTRYVLTEHDVRGGLSHQKHDDMIALADHSLDVHGAGSRRVHGELREPYGVPFRCLLPGGRPNLMVAGRCAGFSHVAASSCRLSRTMLALGRAAGTAARLAVAAGCDPPEIDPSTLRKALFPEKGRP